MNIAIITPPSKGHFKVLQRAAVHWQKRSNLHITMIITAWRDFTLAEDDIRLLHNAGLKVIVLQSQVNKNAGALFCTFNRALEISDKILDLCNDTDIILYDFLSPEGYIAGKKLHIPAVCSIPAIIDTFDKSNPLFQFAMKRNATIVLQIEKKYEIAIANKMRMVSNCLCLLSDVENLVLSWPNLINKSLQDEQCSFIFARPEPRTYSENNLISKLRRKKQQGKKIIYFSVGTVIPSSGWQTVPQLQPFIKYLYHELFTSLANHPQYHVVLSSGGLNLRDLALNVMPSNFHFYKNLDQPQLMVHCDVFITHGGGNSVNEAIDAEVPMIVIPFMFDQHICAAAVSRLGIGLSFEHEKEDQLKAADAHSGVYFRRSLQTSGAIIQAIDKIINNSRFTFAFKKVKKMQPMNLLDINSVLLPYLSKPRHIKKVKYASDKT